MPKVIIAEKPSVARAIAHVLGVSGQQNGYIGNIHSENGTVVTWAIGHLVTLAMPEDYGISGFKRENLPIMPEPFRLIPRQTKKGKEMVVDSGALKQLNTIKELFEKCDEIIVATDAGREGELIFRYIYQYLNSNKPFKRLWISSLTDKAIKNGFENLKKGSEFDNLYQAARSRSQADWLVGINASQALSIAAGSGVYSLGRVQTPTLAMICKRYLEHKNFQIQTYFQIQVEAEVERKSLKMLSDKKFEDKESGQDALEIVRRNKLEITEVDTRTVREEPPLLYDLTGLQKDANKQLNLSADETLAIAQSLYEKKFISYPRTGSRYISEDIWEEIPALVETLLVYAPLKEQVKLLLKNRLNKRGVNDLKVTDHHALLITDNTVSGLSPKEESIYKLIASRMLETFSAPCEKEVTTLKARSREFLFSARGVNVIEAGWRAVSGMFDNENSEEPEISLPYVENGEKYTVQSAQLLEKQTKPKPLHTEASLLSAMEHAGKELENEDERKAIKESGIGTPATRASIIETLFSRDYIERQKKSLVPTTKGLKVYEAVKEKRIADVAMTGMWENTLLKIENGEMSSETFDKSITIYAKQITDELLAMDFPKDKKELLVCPKCQKETVKLFGKVAKCSDETCGWLLFRNVCGKTLSEIDVKEILTNKKTSLQKGLKSKAGKTFDAYIVLKEDGSTEFEFPKKNSRSSRKR
ncbi:MAG: DNA topoisomerase 3 [Bacteroidetes bacterium ADurb.BinA174]|nr:MAG: DNA topoisomerase 3 [Bacteroidetes bacterium ADurb.BinA174]